MPDAGRLGRPRRSRAATVTAVAVGLLAPGPGRAEGKLPFALVDVTRHSGVAFVHDGGRSGRQILSDTIGSGGTLFDADGDGDLDLYLVTSNALDGTSRHARNALFANDGSGTFARASGTGLEVEAFGMGAISFDYDGDGREDVYVTNRGGNRLFRNLGGLRFEDVTARSGTADGRWSACAAAADYDLDGDLDIYVGNYLDFDPKAPATFMLAGVPSFRGPILWPGQENALFRNDGGGKFTDVARTAGVEAPGSRTLGVAFVDLDGDRLPDLVVSNDAGFNHVFRNRGKGRFDDVSEQSGLDAGVYGLPESSMGVAVGDYDGDAREDVVIANFDIETNLLGRNLGNLEFERANQAAGFEDAGPYLAFGADFLDVDDDGDLDLLVTNGHIFEHPERFPPYQGTFAQPTQLFVNDGRGKLRDSRAGAGAFFGRPLVARASIPGDLDDDGDLDVVVTVQDGPAVVLLNTPAAGQERPGRFLSVELAGVGMNRQGIGARVEVTAGGRRQVRSARCGTSYLADADPRIHFGLGAASRVEKVVVRWPRGAVTTLQDVAPDQRLVVREPDPGDGSGAEGVSPPRTH